MPAIRSIDMRLIDDLFKMSGGYVLDFTDKTFGAFFREEIGVTKATTTSIRHVGPLFVGIVFVNLHVQV